MSFNRTEIPRHPRWNGPLVLPAKLPDGYVQSNDGQFQCNTCGRRSNQAKCPHVYMKRTTNFIDILQSEFALKQYDRRMVARGLSQRPDLVLAIAALREIDGADKKALQDFADEAKKAAAAEAGANIGTALHRMTEDMDNGHKLGYVPEPYPADLKAYEEATKDIEWVDIESFRVHDGFKVGGTADRIGWYKGKLRIFDIKTSPKENPISYPHGPAMQFAMYARATAYDIPTDTRVADVAKIDLRVAHIIMLPAGKGRCWLKPVDILAGWGACNLAVKVWEWRNNKKLILDDDFGGASLPDLISRAGSEQELRLIWANAKDVQMLTPGIKSQIIERREELKADPAGTVDF